MSVWRVLQKKDKVELAFITVLTIYSKCNINVTLTKIFYSADEYIFEEDLFEQNNEMENEEEDEDEDEDVLSQNDVINQEDPSNMHNAATCCSKY